MPTRPGRGLRCEVVSKFLIDQCGKSEWTDGKSRDEPGLRISEHHYDGIRNVEVAPLDGQPDNRTCPIASLEHKLLQDMDGVSGEGQPGQFVERYERFLSREVGFGCDIVGRRTRAGKPIGTSLYRETPSKYWSKNGAPEFD